jgi:hypothetical protein
MAAQRFRRGTSFGQDPLSNIDNPHIQRLAHKLLTAVDRASSIWTKRKAAREDVAKGAHEWMKSGFRGTFGSQLLIKSDIDSGSVPTPSPLY